jgi:hypothetical protein
MLTTPLRQAGVLLSAAALLATMTAATVAAPARAAKPKCAGKVATIVGTKKGEVIRGTRRADVIVARGGNDRIYGRGGNDTICGGSGHDLIVGGPGADRAWGAAGRDRLLGGPGPDRLWGGAANDSFNGGIGRDACYQALGRGPKLNCELPAPPAPVVPPPPPEPPTLVIAYSDINNNHLYDAGDVLISKIVDTDKSGTVSPGDTIKMGQYPTSPSVIKPAQIRSQFEDWKVKSHPVATGDLETNPDFVRVNSGTDLVFKWSRSGISTVYDWFEETGPSGNSEIFDDAQVGFQDAVRTELGSPSLPTSGLPYSANDGKGDDGFIDVEIYP